MKKTLIMRNSLLSLLLGLSISGCDDDDIYQGSDVVIIDTSYRGAVVGDGSKEDTNVKVEYFSADDSVRLSAINEIGDDAVKPITIGNGIRISGEDGDEQVQKICSFLGFTSPELGRYTTINDYTSRTEVFESMPANYYDFKVTYPVLHATLVSNPVSGSMFPDTLDIKSHYFKFESDDKKYSMYYNNYNEEIGEKKNYMASITCFGTTLSHFKDNSAINDDYPEMIKSILAAKLATVMKPASNFYTESSFFLIKNADEAWTIRRAFRTIIHMNDLVDDSFLPMAKKGAANICKESGYDNLLSYSIRYEPFDDVSSDVYEFNETTDVWELKTKPTKRTLLRLRGDQPPNVIELPSVFLDKIYCI